ncbi:MAG: NUDIX hydrolase [Candidatus Poseidoniales archaeon]
MNSKNWKTISEKNAGDFRIFSMREVTAESPRTGKHHPFFLLDGSDWINVIAVTSEQMLVMVKQYRFGTSKFELEIPGGIIEKGESPIEAGVRELKEETGYAGIDPKYLGYVDPNPAFQTNKCHTIIIQNCEKVDIQNLDPGEDIEVEIISEANIQKHIDKGTIRHSLVLSAFRLYDIYKRSS